MESFKHQKALGKVGLYQVVKAVSMNPVSYDYAWEIIKDKEAFSLRLVRWNHKLVKTFSQRIVHV